MMCKTFLGMVLGALVVLSLGLGGVSAWANPAALQPQTVDWQLTGAKVVNAGQTTKNDVGTLVSGFAVEATATATGEAAPFPTGQFRMILNVFSPAKDMPGQKAGRWYVRGTWSITDPSASPEAQKARYSNAVVRGDFVAESDSNPLVTAKAAGAAKQGFAGTSRASLSPVEGLISWGAGSISLNERFEGSIRMGVRQRPGVTRGGARP